MAGDDEAMVGRLLAGAGLVAEGAALSLVPLTGGVSCDVWRVDQGGRAICVVKRALAQLRVEADWFAPVERTESEVRWLRRAHAIVPHLCPEVLADDPVHHVFAMQWLPADQHPVWKDELLAGRVDAGFAARVGRDLARVHAATAGDAAVAAEFDNGPLFEALRTCRRELAQEAGVPPYVIFHDSVLREMAATRPASLSALGRLTGASDTVAGLLVLDTPQ